MIVLFSLPLCVNSVVRWAEANNYILFGIDKREVFSITLTESHVHFFTSLPASTEYVIEDFTQLDELQSLRLLGFSDLEIIQLLDLYIVGD
jgi:hypothetical protein